MDELKGIKGVNKLNDFLKALKIDTSKITLIEAVELKSEIEEVLLKNKAVLKGIK